MATPLDQLELLFGFISIAVKLGLGKRGSGWWAFLGQYFIVVHLFQHFFIYFFFLVLLLFYLSSFNCSTCSEFIFLLLA